MTLPGSFAPRTPVPPHRRGACPALATPMQTGDGLLTRFPAQVLATDVLEALAGIAAAAGNGLIEVTARGSIQLRGLTAASAAALLRSASARMATSSPVRNIWGCIPV